MIEHSVFALPFAYIAALTAMWHETSSVHWVRAAADHVAMVVGAHGRDERQPHPRPQLSTRCNPRTARRELVTGELSVRSAWTGTGDRAGRLPGQRGGAVAGCACCSRRSRSFLLVLYSYGKRFTDFPQVLLALAQFVAPVGAWIAVTGDFGWARRSRSGIAVGTWIGGFDLIYSCQDAEVDRRDRRRARSRPASASRPR